jgi:DNA helicase-2/ATP-dependent DNA helicase PcrA
MEAARAERVVVFDLETTGLSVGLDEIVEIAAARCGSTGTVETFHAYLRPSQPVGPSEHVHHLSDIFLAAHGEEPAVAIERFRAFCAGSVLAGHNVPLFDLPMLESVCPRLGLEPWPEGPVFDTLDLARRFFRLPRYTLGEICTRLGLKAVPTHRADADVEATVELLGALLPKIEAGLSTRVEAVKRYGARFLPLARQMEGWRAHLQTERPHELLDRVLNESGLRRHYGEDEERLDNLNELVTHFERFDDPDLRPADALPYVVSMASLAREVDGQRFNPDELALLTVHQAKGLEFDTVFIAGAAENEFPNRRSLREGREAEEHRLFYVAVSRAKRRLFLSYSLLNSWGREQMRSRYTRLIVDRS